MEVLLVIATVIVIGGVLFAVYEAITHTNSKP